MTLDENYTPAESNVRLPPHFPVKCSGLLLAVTCHAHVICPKKTISMPCVCLTPPNLTLQGIESTTIRVGKYKIKFGKGEPSQCAVLALWSFRVTFDRGLHAHLPCCWHTPIQCGDSPVSGAVLVQMKTIMQTAPLMVRDLHSPQCSGHAWHCAFAACAC